MLHAWTNYEEDINIFTTAQRTAKVNETCTSVDIFQLFKKINILIIKANVSKPVKFHYLVPNLLICPISLSFPKTYILDTNYAIEQCELSGKYN